MQRNLSSALHGTMIESQRLIEEGGVEPLLKFIQEAPMKGQEIAARAIALLVCDRESVEYMIRAGVCKVFVKILREGPHESSGCCGLGVVCSCE